jgi:hypothetical protein
VGLVGSGVGSGATVTSLLLAETKELDWVPTAKITKSTKKSEKQSWRNLINHIVLNVFGNHALCNHLDTKL